ncbi:MAG: SUMF1/EgtB/PvdO family nonheme iron enzyme, partial [Pirellulales bacterium]|nr:SUMF1/EgtB/PvdO family nonheme iron enzyme [Pirellulales bacterium]
MKHCSPFVFATLFALACIPLCRAEEKIDFVRDIQPLIESACLNCHQAGDADGELRLDTRAAALAGGENGASIVPGKPDESPFYTTMLLAADEDGAMPPDGPRLDKSQTDRVKKWILAGAEWPANAKLEVQPRIEFVKHVQPLLEQNCVSCHRPDKAEADFDLTTRRAAMTTGGSAPALVPFEPSKSSLYTLTILPKLDAELMPPVSSGGPLDKKQTEVLRLWIAQGALWPESIKLKPRAKDSLGPPSPDNSDLVKKIHALIVANDKKSAGEKMTNYEGKIPKTGVAYHMVAIPGGTFMMGSPEGEAHRAKNEGPQVKVKVEPFWIGKFEVTWDEYEPFMITQVDRAKHGARIDFDSKVHTIVDAVSQPTPPYVEMSFGMGQKGYPAISMTQHAASKYCQWLSAQTGHFYRLPTEAEWEYACRAGTTTAYSFGDDASKIDQYAWYYENSNEKYQKVGKKKPNPWGLHDMHGNVMEWTIDQYTEDYFTRIAKSAANPLVKPEKLYPRSVRGGNWDDDAEQLRSAFRRGSAPEWKQQDPQLPKSIWYHTNA